MFKFKFLAGLSGLDLFFWHCGGPCVACILRSDNPEMLQGEAKSREGFQVPNSRIGLQNNYYTVRLECLRFPLNGLTLSRPNRPLQEISYPHTLKYTHPSQTGISATKSTASYNIITTTPFSPHCKPSSHSARLTPFLSGCSHHLTLPALSHGDSTCVTRPVTSRAEMGP